MYQQQEIHRLHQVTMNIRQRIEGDVYQKGSQPSSHEVGKKRAKVPMEEKNFRLAFVN